MDPLMERMFNEIDNQAEKTEELAKVTYTGLGTLNILAKLILLIITFLVLAGLTVVCTNLDKAGKTETKQEKTSLVLPGIPVKGRVEWLIG